MGKSWRKNSDRYFKEDLTIYSKNEQEYRRHKSEKRLNAALKSKDLSSLPDTDFDDED